MHRPHRGCILHIGRDVAAPWWIGPRNVGIEEVGQSL